MTNGQLIANTVLVPFVECKLRVPTEVESWPEGRAERVSVNGFGIGGVNAHVSSTTHNLVRITNNSLERPGHRNQLHPKISLLVMCRGLKCGDLHKRSHVLTRVNVY
jgi:hypothetical protein